MSPIARALSSGLAEAAETLSFQTRFESVQRGILELRDLAFFVLLALYDTADGGGGIILNVSFVLFVLAGITDVLDGYLARKWNTVTAFGRVTDPFVDMVLV